MTLLRPDKLVWQDDPGPPKGTQIASLLGDPTKAGDVVVLRAKFPPNYLVPPHTHPHAETVTLISGSIGFGVGKKVEKTSDLLEPGAFFAQPANHAHSGWTGDQEAIIEVHFVGPGGITYINPADDPREMLFSRLLCTADRSNRSASFSPSKTFDISSAANNARISKSTAKSLAALGDVMGSRTDNVGHRHRMLNGLAIVVGIAHEQRPSTSAQP